LKNDVPADIGFALKVTNPTPYHATVARLPTNGEEITPVERFAKSLCGAGNIRFELVDRFCDHRLQR
jgi:hypothetical protein